MTLSKKKKITITVTEDVLIQLFYLNVVSKQKKEWEQGISWHLHIIQKSQLYLKKGSPIFHFLAHGV